MKGKLKRKSPNLEALEAGLALHDKNPLFAELRKKHTVIILDRQAMGRGSAAWVRYQEKRYWRGGRRWEGAICLNRDFAMTPAEWAYTVAHCELHLAFGHFDAEKMPGYEKIAEDGTRTWHPSFDARLWNEACDIYIAKFLSDIKFGQSTGRGALPAFSGAAGDEWAIYEALRSQGGEVREFRFGTAAPGVMDMQGLEHPVVYDAAKNERNEYIAAFAFALTHSVAVTVSEAGGHTAGRGEAMTTSEKAAQWFINHYPLLGGLAAGFKVIEDYDFCRRNEIFIAAVDVTKAEIYVNQAAGLSDEELRFVLAHEYLHAGLRHHERRQGRDPFFWNIACDYVINGWLREMQVGTMPEQGELYDESLRGQSAEEIYDRIITDMRRFAKLATFRGRGKGDILGGRGGYGGTTSLDDFYRSALETGLEYHRQSGRGYIPAGLVQEIRALAMPPIPWDVALGRWFDHLFAPLAARRTYARPSRRQGSTPDIPRPRYVPADVSTIGRTFGVVVDTSGSMSAKRIGYALGAIASYAAAKEVPAARVVFCDAAAYDAGYLAPEDIAGRVEVRGRGGTILQPGVNLLLDAADFPKDAPILLITDGAIESRMTIPREHAFLLPKGCVLPFRAKGKVFRFSGDAS